MIRLVISNQTNPYLNIAVENYLLSLPETEAVTMYLWKNHRTVVIGQNQNPFAECNVDLLESEGGYLMRRRTGGGAVYHDQGNLNFSFVAPKALYDQTKQFSVLQQAVEQFGLYTEVSGRNDVLCRDHEGAMRKFSGNAFNKNRYQDLHHGTILIKGNIDDLQRYLLVKPAKLHKHGVESVRSRVVNLSELADITSENIVMPLIGSFEKVYGEKAELLDFSALCKKEEVVKLASEFASDEWRLGRWRSFQSQKTAQFSWGGVEMSLDVDQTKGVITSVQIATDSLCVSISALAEQILTGGSIHQAPDMPLSVSEEEKAMLQDIFSLVY